MPVLNHADSGKVSATQAARLAKSGKQGERTPPQLLDHIADELFRRPQIKAAQLYAELLNDAQWSPLLPNPRAFRGHVAGARERLEQGRWSPVNADDEEARLVLPILGKLQRPEHLGPDFSVTPRIAKWIARLCRWAPDLEGAGEYLLYAIHYADRIERGAVTDDLDARIARRVATGPIPEKETK